MKKNVVLGVQQLDSLDRYKVFDIIDNSKANVHNVSINSVSKNI